MTKENQQTEEEGGIGIYVDDTMDCAVHKILKGEENVIIYLPEKVARKIAAGVLEERVSIKNIPIIDDTGEKLCQAKIEIIYKD